MALLGLDPKQGAVQGVLAGRPLPDLQVRLGLEGAGGPDQDHGQVVRRHREAVAVVEPVGGLHRPLQVTHARRVTHRRLGQPAVFQRAATTSVAPSRGASSNARRDQVAAALKRA